MAVMTVERDVAAPAETVWALVTDLDRTNAVVSAITALERTDDGSGFGVGTAWRETRVMFGRESTESMAVTEIDEGRSYVVESLSRGVLYRSVMRIEPNADGCHLVWDFGAEAQSTSAKLMSVIGKLFEGSTKKALLKDLEDIAAAAETDVAEVETDAADAHEAAEGDKVEA
jgi:carbon monoxide dehydrogenase subunit G